MRKILLLISIFSFLLGLSQPQKRNSPITIRGVIGIPRVTSSKMFRTSFKGTYDGNLSVNARLFTNFFAGAGYENCLFQNNKEVFAFITTPPGQSAAVKATTYNTKLMGQGGFVKIGYDQFFEKGYVSYSINTGYMKLSYHNVNQDSSKENMPFIGTTFSCPYVQPEISINFMADRAMSFSIILSYTTLFYKYDSRAPRFAHIGEVQKNSNNYFISWINIGFGFNVHIRYKD